MTPDEQRVRELRELLPATGAGIYLDTATSGPLPAETAAAMREAEEWELRVGRIWEGRDEDVAQRMEEARAVVAALLGADPARITLTPGLDDAFDVARRQLGERAEVVDVSDRAGVVATNVSALGADAVVLATDRWLLGPEQTGALWLATGPSPERHLPRTTLIGLARSVGWLEMYVGLDWAFQRTARLAERLYSGLGRVSGIEVLTEHDALVAIVSFRLANWNAVAAAEELSGRVHAIVRPIPDQNAIRASVAWFNTEEEIDRFVSGVAELAGHTSATLPRRPALIVQ